MRDSKGRFKKGMFGIWKGKKFSIEHRKNISKAKLGSIPWNKGKRTLQSTIEKIRRKKLGKRNSPKTEFKKGMTPWNKGLKGVMKAWNKGISPSAETRAKISAHNAQRGKRSRNWRGGITMNEGYVFVYQPLHPRADKKGYIKRANLVMEKHLDRFLKKGEIVHHINEIKTDDRIENFKLFPNQSKYQKFHYLFNLKFKRL